MSSASVAATFFICAEVTMSTLCLFALLSLAAPGDVAHTAPAVLAYQEEHPDHAHAHDHAHDHAEHFDEAVMDGPIPARRTKLRWMIEALGIRYVLLIPGSGLFAFIGSLAVVLLCKRPASIAAFLPFVALPFLIGLFGFFDGLITMFSIVADSTRTPKPAEYAGGMSMALFTPFAGMLVAAPAFFVTSIGLFLRTLMQRELNEVGVEGLEPSTCVL
jgi:hypothetical protein